MIRTFMVEVDSGNTANLYNCLTIRNALEIGGIKNVNIREIDNKTDSDKKTMDRYI